MTFVCKHCGNHDPEEIYVESKNVAGVCTSCVDNEWLTCDECKTAIGPDDDRHTSDTVDGVFCCEECLEGAEISHHDWHDMRRPYEGGLRVWG